MFSKSFLSIKKNFDVSLDQSILNQHDNSDYTSDEELPTQINENLLRISIESQDHEIPKSLLGLEDLHSLMSYEKYQKLFTADERAHLQSLLPTGVPHDKVLKSLFAGDTFYMVNPLDSFLEHLRSGHFSHIKQQEIHLQHQLYNHSILEHFESIYDNLKDRLEDDVSNLRQTCLYKRKNTQLLEDLFTDGSDQEKKSISALSLENSFSELSQGYSTPISLTEEHTIQSFPKKHQEMNLTLQENRMIEARKTLLDPSKVKKPIHITETDSLHSSKAVGSNNNNHSNINISLPKSSTLPSANNNNNSSTGKKPTKNVNSREWVENFRSQESERYSNPTRPFTYVCSDGSKGIVAPVSKKISFTSATKPRDHFLLKTERPPYITILCLVRDAASRLPNGFGTRADICELLKESQFINEHVPDDKLSNIVSGALDRLHYEDDACVKYDPEKKLWIYLHKGRTENYPSWMEQNDSRSSKKKEYNQKYKNKKRVRIEDIKTIHK